MASGYIIVKRFDVLYDAALRGGRYNDNPKNTSPIYRIPHRNRPVPPQGMPKYRGIDREPLRALLFEEARIFTEAGTPSEANAATNLLNKIELTNNREDGWVTTSEEILAVWDALEDMQADYEIVFAKEFKDGTESPSIAQFLGCDAAYFVSDHFSCICDALFIPRWHGTDPEGILFKDYFCRLNRNGLFNSNEETLEYLRYYLSFDWTEKADNFTSIEVYSVEAANI